MATQRADRGTPPLVAPGVTYACAGDSCVVFDSTSGAYYTLHGRTALAWLQLTRQDSTSKDLETLAVHVDAFSDLGLMSEGEAREARVASEAPEFVSQEICRHSEFDHLVHQEPGHDLDLLGHAHHAPLPQSNRRTMVDRLRVRRFTSTLMQDAHAFAANQGMLAFRVALGNTTIRVQVPETDGTSSIPLSRAFMSSERVAEMEDTFCITVIDDSMGAPRRPTDFEMDWHFPLGLLDPELTGDTRVAVDRHTQTVSVFEPKTRQCVVWTKNFSSLPYWFAATPLRLQLSWIADSLGLEFLHASAVTIDDRAVVFAGPSGAGKSTTALMLAQRGFSLISDDFLVASRDAVQGVYRRVKVHDANLTHTVGRDWTILNPDTRGQKRIIELDQALDSDVVPIACIVVPKLGSSCHLAPMNKGDALSAIAPASLSGLLGGNPASLARIAHLVEQFPCFQLTLDESLLHDSRALESLVEDLRAVEHVSSIGA